MADLSLIKTKANANGVDCREITIDTNLPYQDQFVVINYSQLDSESRFLKITYCIGGRVIELTDLNKARILLYKEADGTNIIDDCYVDTVENVIYCQLNTQAMILSGTDNLAFLLTEYHPETDTTSAIISSTFSLKVNKCVVSSDVTTSPEYTSFVNGLQTLDTFSARITLLETSVGDITLLNTTDKTNLVNAVNELNNSKLNKTGDASNTTVAFTEATTLANVNTGESSTTLFGKIKKFFTFIGTTVLTTTAQTISAAINEVNANDILKLPKSGGTMTGNLILNVDPTSNLQAATKQYVDAVASGLDIKKSVFVATISNLTVSSSTTTTLTLSSAITSIDGNVLTVGNRILVKDQTTASQNGIYSYTSSTLLTRTSDADTNTKMNSGMFTFVEQGTVNADSGWVLTTNDTITIGTTALTFTQFSGAGQIIAGTGIDKSGNTLSLTSSVLSIINGSTTLNSATAGVGVTELTGGYIKIGRIVLLEVSFTIASSLTGHQSIITGIPIALFNKQITEIKDKVSNDSYAIYSNLRIYTGTSTGSIYLADSTLPTGSYTLSTHYIAAS